MIDFYGFALTLSHDQVLPVLNILMDNYRFMGFYEQAKIEIIRFAFVFLR